MKKLIFLFIPIFFGFIVNAQILWPYGVADVRSETLDSTSLDIAEIYDNMTIITCEELDTNIIVTTTISDEIRSGAILYLYFDADASNRTVTFSTGLTGAAVTVTANKTQWIGFLYNGTAFKKFLSTQID